MDRKSSREQIWNPYNSINLKLIELYRLIYTIPSYLVRPLLRHKGARQKRYGRITQKHRRINKYKTNKTLVYGRENGHAGQRAVVVATNTWFAGISPK